MERRRARKERRREEEKGGSRGVGVGGRPGVQWGLTLLAVEDRQEAKHEGPTGGGKEAPPVIPDGEVGRHDLDTEQDAWEQWPLRQTPPLPIQHPDPSWPVLLGPADMATPPLWSCGGEGRAGTPPPREHTRVCPSQPPQSLH